MPLELPQIGEELGHALTEFLRVQQPGHLGVNDGCGNAKRVNCRGDAGTKILHLSVKSRRVGPARRPAVLVRLGRCSGVVRCRAHDRHAPYRDGSRQAVSQECPGGQRAPPRTFFGPMGLRAREDAGVDAGRLFLQGPGFVTKPGAVRVGGVSGRRLRNIVTVHCAHRRLSLSADRKECRPHMRVKSTLLPGDEAQVSVR